MSSLFREGGYLTWLLSTALDTQRLQSEISVRNLVERVRDFPTPSLTSRLLSMHDSEQEV